MRQSKKKESVFTEKDEEVKNNTLRFKLSGFDFIGNKVIDDFQLLRVTQKFLNIGLSPAAAMRVAKVAQPAGIATLAGEGLYNVAKYSKPNYYIGPDGEPTFYKREKATDVLPTMLDVYEQADKISREQGIPYQEALKQVLNSNQKTILLVIYISQNQKRYIGVKLD